MTNIEIIKMLFSSYNNKDDKGFMKAAEEYIQREKLLKHNIAVYDLENILYDKANNNLKSNKRFKNSIPIPRDNDKGFPLLEILNYDEEFEKLILSDTSKNQINQIIKEYRESDILASYNLRHKSKILFCGKPGTGKTFTAKLLSPVFQLPLICVRFDAIISSYLGETAGNLRKVFDFVEKGEYVVLFDEVVRNSNIKRHFGRLECTSLGISDDAGSSSYLMHFFKLISACIIMWYSKLCDNNTGSKLYNYFVHKFFLKNGINSLCFSVLTNTYQFDICIKYDAEPICFVIPMEVMFTS